MYRLVSASFKRAAFPRRPGKIVLQVGPSNGSKTKKRSNAMNDQTRVLIRQGSRELSPEEVEQVGGGFNTLSITWGPNGRDGDGSLGES
jgi:hypothetical protein